MKSSTPWKVALGGLFAVASVVAATVFTDPTPHASPTVTVYKTPT